MILGQSAATAAVLSIERGVALQDLPFADLRARLLADKQVLDLPPDVAERRTILKSNLPGIVADDVDAQLTGEWTSGATVSPFLGVGYLHDGNLEKGGRQARFTLTVPTDGRYEVRLAYTPNPNRATNVPVRVTHAAGVAELTVDQRKTPEIDRLLHPLGRFMLRQNAPVVIEISNAGTNGHVIVDGVQLLPVTSEK